MNPRFCDLHTHSTASDGTFSPAELIGEAVRVGLSAVALCDHNTADGLGEFLAAAEGKPIEAVAGAEFSVDYEGRELHLLALFLSPEAIRAVREMTEESNREKELSNRALALSLCKAGYLVDYEEIRAATPNGQVNRAHFAAALQAMGYVASVNEAFATVLSEEAGHYRPPKRRSVFDVIDEIRRLRAVPVLAHPFLNLTEEELRAFLPRAIEHGLVGMETRYSEYSEETATLAHRIAKEYGLLESGGSDFHGSVKPHIALGTGRGGLFVPYSVYEKLKTAARRL